MSHHDTLTSRVLLAGEPAIGVVEITLPRAWDGPPLHHHDFDETFHVLEGELTVANASDEPARYLPGAAGLHPSGRFLRDR